MREGKLQMEDQKVKKGLAIKSCNVLFNPSYKFCLEGSFLKLLGSLFQSVDPLYMKLSLYSPNLLFCTIMFS